MQDGRKNGKHFLFLQGPHGPFFNKLGRMLRTAGAKTHRVGFNSGDAFFWRNKSTYIPFVDTPDAWAPFLEHLLDQHTITDLVLYGDTRPIHATAVEIAKARDITIHVFEEGYLRPYWVSYERGGSNGNSNLMDMSVAEMQKALSNVQLDMTEAPAHWGDMRHHIFYGALYHWFVMCTNRHYRNFRPHRKLKVWQEFALHLRRLLLMPYLAYCRIRATRHIKHGGFPYHLALLQLEHDASFQQHSPFSSMSEFLQLVIEGFAKGAPLHHHLVIKAHPLEDGRFPQRRLIQKMAAENGIVGRVHYVRGGKLARLLDHARSAVTVNSTAAQQALWRAMPLKVFGDAVFDKPEFTSSQSLDEFFTAPTRPDSGAYRDYRQFLLETSQVPGGYYSASGRIQLLRQIVDMMLSDTGPYQALIQGTAAPRQQLPSSK